MPTKSIDIQDAQSRLADLVSLAQSGTDVILMEGETPLARIVPMAATNGSRVAGLHLGSMSASEDFDEPLPDAFWTGAT